MLRIKHFKNDAYVTLEKTESVTGPVWECIAVNPAGQRIDRIRCYSYAIAMQFYRAFQKLAKNS